MAKRKATSLLAFVLLLSPVTVLAAPATIRVFEAQVHAAPDPSSPVVYTFAENTRVSVSEDSINGFRKVRLPGNKIGYIEESALALAGAPPPTPPPPPGFDTPPPPAPPPPGYGWPPPPPPRAPRYYPVRRYPDPTAFRHVGFFLRFDAGLGYTDSSTSASTTAFNFDSAHGLAGELGLAIGGAVAENFLLAAHFWGTSVVAPTLTARGVAVPTGGDFSVSLFGLGPSFDYYFMPNNVYVTVTPSLTWVSFSDAFSTFQTAAGFGTRFALGKEWWISGHWGLGLAGWFAFSFNKESDAVGPTWRTYAGGLSFSMTFN
ncbi:MAG TPA: SH3 domain-containing protein [Anaeromyxobacteraceae bacterium]